MERHRQACQSTPKGRLGPVSAPPGCHPGCAHSCLTQSCTLCMLLRIKRSALHAAACLNSNNARHVASEPWLPGCMQLAVWSSHRALKYTSEPPNNTNSSTPDLPDETGQSNSATASVLACKHCITASVPFSTHTHTHHSTRAQLAPKRMHLRHTLRMQQRDHAQLDRET